ASGKDNFNNFWNAAALAGLSVQVAEQIDPALVAEFFWRALSFHPRSAAKDPDDRWGLRAAAVGSLALAVARYDRDIALALLDTVQVPRLDTNFAGVSVFRAAALADPARAVKMLAALPPGRTTDSTRDVIIAM